MLRLLPTLLVLALWVYAFVDCLNTPENEVRKLPKAAWVLVILFFGTVLLGPVAWFAVGRPRRNAPYGATRPAERRWVAPDDNPDFLKSIGDGPRTPPSPPGPEAPGVTGTGTADGAGDGDGDADGAGGKDAGGRERRRGGDDGSEGTPPPA